MIVRNNGSDFGPVSCIVFIGVVIFGLNFGILKRNGLGLVEIEQAIMCKIVYDMLEPKPFMASIEAIFLNIFFSETYFLTN